MEIGTIHFTNLNLNLIRMELINLESALQLLISFVIGTAIGLEREYRSKAAGLRTMIMICVGSTIFTEVSIALGVNSPDRIASNIITGIGFLGAGVIFKDGLTISGITTATTIWITAALGMAVGAGQYPIAVVGSLIILVVLTLFETFQVYISRIHQERSYKITFKPDDNFANTIEKELNQLRLKFKKEKDMKIRQEYVILVQVYGGERKLEQFNTFLKNSAQIVAFEY